MFDFPHNSSFLNIVQLIYHFLQTMSTFLQEKLANRYGHSVQFDDIEIKKGGIRRFNTS